tara:strand:- start:18 stop:623 length:606 start_codon:yes stop_codon:yes gene_type:complete
MIKLLIAALILTGCGGGGSEAKTEKPPVAIETPVKDTLIIHRNTVYTSSTSISTDIKAIITKAVFSQEDRYRLDNCNYTCFSPEDSILLGDDKDCADCVLLNHLLYRYERDNGVQVFIIIEDELTLLLTEELLSRRGYSNIVLVSSSEELLLSASYNYSTAIIGESTDTNIDWHITSNKDCSAKCISQVDVGFGVFDGVIL